MRISYSAVKRHVVASFCVSVVVSSGLLIGCVTSLYRINANASNSLDANLKPIAELSDMRVLQSDTRLQLRRIQALHDPAVTSAGIERIQQNKVLLQKAWSRYYPDGVSSGEEQAAAEKIRIRLVDYASTVDDALFALHAQNNADLGVVTNRLAEVVTDIDAEEARAIHANLAQATRFVHDSDTVFRRSLLTLGSIAGLGLVLQAGMLMFVFRVARSARRAALSCV